jgi:two-component system chemotaxis response regulator CheY
MNKDIVDVPKDLKILIVDDSDHVRKVLAGFLKQNRFKNVHTAIDGKRGLESIQKSFKKREFFELLFLDINMPNKNGFDLLEKIKSSKEFSYLAVIMCTTESEVPIVIKAIDAGADGYIIKPFNESSVLENIQKVYFEKIAKRRSWLKKE